MSTHPEGKARVTRPESTQEPVGGTAPETPKRKGYILQEEEESMEGLVVSEAPALYQPSPGPLRQYRPFGLTAKGKPAPPARKGPVPVVRGFLQPLGTPGPFQAMPTAELIERLEEGLPISELDALQGALGVPLEVLAGLLGISKATLHRRRGAGHALGREESDRVVRFARLMGRAVEVLESEAAARAWLKAPQVGLGGAIPLEYARTEVGAREVEELLGRIEYGVYA